MESAGSLQIAVSALVMELLQLKLAAMTCEADPSKNAITQFKNQKRMQTIKNESLHWILSRFVFIQIILI